MKSMVTNQHHAQLISKAEVWDCSTSLLSPQGRSEPQWPLGDDRALRALVVAARGSSLITGARYGNRARASGGRRAARPPTQGYFTWHYSTFHSSCSFTGLSVRSEWHRLALLVKCIFASCGAFYFFPLWMKEDVMCR